MRMSAVRKAMANHRVFARHDGNWHHDWDNITPTLIMAMCLFLRRLLVGTLPMGLLPLRRLRLLSLGFLRRSLRLQ